MVKSAAATVAEYLLELTEDRREAIAQVRQVILDHLPEGYQETMQYGMISYVIPLERFAKTYNKQPLAVVLLAAQKNYLSLYLMGVYGDPTIEQWFKERYQRSGHKLNQGKCCLRFKRVADLPTDLIGEVVARVSVDDFITMYETARGVGARS